MADIEQIKIPDGNTHNIKDAVARSGLSGKVDNHPGLPAGKYLQTDDNGDAVWGEAASPSAVVSATETWLENNIPSGTTIAIDRSLSISNAAAPADLVGDLKSELNIIREHTKNLFESENVMNAYLTSGKIKANDGCRLVWIPCKASTTYTISKTAGTRFAVAATSTLPAVGVTIGSVSTNYTGSSITIETGSDSRYLVAWVYNSGSDSGTAETMLASVQIELGSTATTYEQPYTAVDLNLRDIAFSNQGTIPGTNLATDLDTFYGKDGFYTLELNSAYGHDPVGKGKRRSLICYTNGATYTHQIMFSSSTGDVYQRVYRSGGWTQWKNFSGYESDMLGSFNNRICTSHAGIYTNSKYQNSPKAFIDARKMGIKYQELDVVFTSDLVPVLAHSSFADNAIRISDGDTSRILFKNFTLSELKTNYVFGDSNYTWTILTLAEAYSLLTDLGCVPIIDVGGGENNPVGSRETLINYMIENGIKCEALITSERDSFQILCQTGGERYPLGIVVAADTDDSVSAAEIKIADIINAKSTLNLEKAWCFVRRERMETGGDLVNKISSLLEAGIKIAGYSYNEITYSTTIPTFFSLVISASVNINYLRYLDAIDS